MAYCSWASHRLPDVWEDPEAFVPERFTRERKAQLARGAYVPFGGGSRTSTLFMSLSRKIIRFVDTIHREQVTTPVRFL